MLTLLSPALSGDVRVIGRIACESWVLEGDTSDLTEDVRFTRGRSMTAGNASFERIQSEPLVAELEETAARRAKYEADRLWLLTFGEDSRA